MTTNYMKIFFDVSSFYYLPQYIPVYDEFISRGHQCSFIIHSNLEQNHFIEDFFKQCSTEREYEFIEASSLHDFYCTQEANWIFFGNTKAKTLKNLPTTIRTALLYHGIGIKSCYYDANLNDFNVRFTEGHFRQNALQKMHPEVNFVEVGFAKLDNISKVSEKISLSELELDPNKETILYAPTFYPSSIELMPKNWPLTFKDFNIILKPHYLTLTKSKYIKQKQLLEHWSTFENVFFCNETHISIVPFMTVSDTLLSEASSTLFEFAALNKPVIWLDFVKLRLGYRGIFKFRLKNRMDSLMVLYENIAAHVSSPKHLHSVITKQLKCKDELSVQRKKATQELIGDLDGQVSNRICNYIESFKN